MRSLCCPCVCMCVCLCVRLCIPLSSLGNGSVKFPSLLLGNGYVFYAVRVVSKASRRLVLPRTSCIIFIFDLLNDAVTYSDYIVLNYKMI
jgi:hypothetical protein